MISNKEITEYCIEPDPTRKVLGVRYTMVPFYSALLGLFEDGEALTLSEIKTIFVTLGGSEKTVAKDVMEVVGFATRIGKPIMERSYGRTLVYSYPEKENSTLVLKALLNK